MAASPSVPQKLVIDSDSWLRGDLSGSQGKKPRFPPLHHLVLSPTAPQGFPMYWNQEPVQHGIMNTGHRLLFLSALL